MLTTTWNILAEAAAFVLMGLVVAGLAHAVLSRWSFARHLAGKGPRGIVVATLVGLPLPLCSCSVLPTALTLRRKGASPGATLAFLVSTPETSVTSIALTFGLLGPIMAVARPVAACVTSIVAGLAGDLVASRSGSGGDDAAGEACGCGPVEEVVTDTVPEGWARRIAHGLRFAFVDLFDDIFGWVLLGIVVAAALRVFVPPETLLGVLGGPVRTMVLMVVIGVPLYVCAEASTPIAAALVAGSVSPGAALVFLLVGPATNIGAVGVLDRALGRRVVVAYLVSIVLVSVLMGVALDALVGPGDVVARVGGGHHERMLPSVVTGLAGAVFLGLGVVTVLRRWSRSRPTAPRSSIESGAPRRRAHHPH